MIPEYKYRVKDFSIVTPGFRDYVVQPLMKFIPWGMPANIITIISNSMMFIALTIALFGAGSITNYILISAFVFIYAVGDHIDGMQAKRTKTSSALGEWFDHFLDSFNTGVLLVILFAVFKIDNIHIVVFILSINYLAHVTVFFEQYKTGWLYFEKIGSLEVVFFSCLIILFNCITPIKNFLALAPYNNIKLVEWFFLFSAIGTFITFVKTAYRARIVEFRFYMFVIFLVFVSLILMKSTSWLMLCIIVTLYSAYYIGNLMRGHLVDGKSYVPDIVIPTILVISFFGHFHDNPVLFNSLIILEVIGIVYIFYISVYTLRDYWFWKNPKP